MNPYYEGEKLVISGRLLKDNIQTSDYQLEVRIYKWGNLVKSVKFDIQSNGYYNAVIDTTGLVGMLTLKFIASTGGRDIVVGNQDVEITVEKL